MNESPASKRRAPVCAGLSLALPVSGILLTFIMVSLPAIRPAGNFASFAPAIIAGLAAFPLGLIGVALAITAMMRREKWVAVAVLGIILDLLLVLVSAPLVWTALQ